MKYLTTIPFSGFYESIHNHVVTDALERYILPCDDQTGEPLPECVDAIWRNNWFDWRKAYEIYSKKYVNKFSEKLEEETGQNLGLEFESLESPKEYNFTTDRIYTYISSEALESLISYVLAEHREALEKTIVNRFTSRSGFSSFYTNDLEAWLKKLSGPLDDLDHNEIGTLLECLLGDYETEQALALELIEELSMDGALDYQNCLSNEGWDYINATYDYETNQLAVSHWGIFGQDSHGALV